MDICVLNPFFYPYKGGTEKVLYEVYRRLAKRHNISVVTSKPPGSRGNVVEEIEGIQVLRLRSRYISLPFAPLAFVSMIGLPSAIREARCEIYHINNRYQYFNDTVAAIRGVGGKMALTIHNALPIGIDPVVDALGLTHDKVWGRELMRKSDLITGVSRNTIETSVPKGELGKTYLVYNGVDYKRFRPAGRGSEKVREVMEGLGGRCLSDDANIMTNGRLVEQKGQIYLIRAVAELKKEGHDLGLLIVGKGQLEKRLRSEAYNLGLRGRFWIRNGIEEEKLPYYYNAGDVFVAPSLYEPASVALLEAMSCEVPSIASRVGGLPEMMGSYGQYVRPKDPDEIKERILCVLNDRKRARALAERGRRFIIKNHDWDKIAKRYERLFLNTLRY
jgi:glycosyltransferase involved in cell wall biosynthesis